MAGEPLLPNLPLRRIEQALWWLAIALLISAATAPLIAGMPPRMGSLLAGGGLAALGLNVLLGGDVIAGPTPRSYTARGQIVRGRLEAIIGLATLTVGEGPEDVIAKLLSGPFSRPRFDVEEEIATLRLGAKRPFPLPAHWRADLAANVLWDIDLVSSLGDLVLDLSNLRLEHVTLESISGAIRVVCPQKGFARIDVRTDGGEVELAILEGAGAHIEVQAGLLATVSVINERLLAPGQSRYVTADLETAPAQIEVTIQTETGDVVLI